MERGSASLPLVVEEEKHETRASIQALWFLGGARPVGAPMPYRKGRNGPQLRFLASWGASAPASFDAQSWGTYPPGWRLFLMLWLTLLLFLKPWSGYPCLRSST